MHAVPLMHALGCVAAQALVQKDDAVDDPAQQAADQAMVALKDYELM